MLNEIKGDIFNWIKDGGIICHQTNYFGVMGAGIAAAIRHKLLSNEQYAKYVELCKMGGRTLLGQVQYLECGGGITVANCFCQDDRWASATSPNSAYTITRYYEMKRCFVDIRSKAKLEGKRVFIQTFGNFEFFVDGKPVGMAKLRYFLTEALRQGGGHLGYAVAPAYRGHGYAAMMVEAIKPVAAEKGIDELLVTVHNDNPASIKTALKCGGRIERVTEDRHYIWIPCR